jgi:hypothetical protein
MCPSEVSLTTRDGRPWFLEALRKRIRETESEEHLSLLVNAIADRRIRDLSDVVSELESALGWEQVVTYLSQVGTKEYPTPFDMGSKVAHLEPLKYREVLFELFSCKGLEPVNVSTGEVLGLAATECSSVDASRLIFRELRTKASEQIEEGDAMFFETDAIDADFPEDLKSLVNSTLEQQMGEVRLERRGNVVDVGPLWYTHIGLQALVDIGVKGRFIDDDSLAMVLSVLQASVPISSSILEVQEFQEQNPNYPSHEDYLKLLGHLMNQDIWGLMHLGSRLAVPTLTFILNEQVSEYKERGIGSSETYRGFLRTITAHAKIRSVDSVISLGNLCSLDEPRLSTAAVVALASFYDQSAVHALAALLCSTNDDAVIQAASNAIMNISNKCMEATQALTQILTQEECGHPIRIRKLLESIPHRRYYL